MHQLLISDYLPATFILNESFNSKATGIICVDIFMYAVMQGPFGEMTQLSKQR